MSEDASKEPAWGTLTQRKWSDRNGPMFGDSWDASQEKSGGPHPAFSARAKLGLLTVVTVINSQSRTQSLSILTTDCQQPAAPNETQPGRCAFGNNCLRSPPVGLGQSHLMAWPLNSTAIDRTGWGPLLDKGK